MVVTVFPSGACSVLASSGDPSNERTDMISGGRVGGLKRLVDPRNGLEVRARQALRPVKYDYRGGALAARELLADELQRPQGLGAIRQKVPLVVGRHVGERRRRGDDDGANHDPDGDDTDGPAPAGGESRQKVKHLLATLRRSCPGDCEPIHKSCKTRLYDLCRRVSQLADA